MNISITTELSTKANSGMGSTLLKNGAAFRLWAPNAESVFVLGSFHDFDAARDRLTLSIYTLCSV